MHDGGQDDETNGEEGPRHGVALVVGGAVRFENEVYGFLSGERHSNGLRARFVGGVEHKGDRLTILEEIARGQSVVHVGCVDHLSLIDSKIQKGSWLHERLCRSAKRCLGVDTNAEGIAALKERWGYQDVVCADIEREPVGEITGNRWDIMIIAEVLEHVNSPVDFLTAIRRGYRGSVGRVIITGPNAMSWSNVRAAIRGEEVINSDHRYWFTPYTLSKIGLAAGLRLIWFDFCNPMPPPDRTESIGERVKSVVREWIERRRPVLRETIIAEFSLSWISSNGCGHRSKRRAS